MDTQKIKNIEDYRSSSDTVKHRNLELNKKIVITLLFMAITILGGCFILFGNGSKLLDDLKIGYWNDNGRTQPHSIAIDSGMHYQFSIYKNDIIQCSKDGIKAINTKGENEWSVAMTLSNPFLQVSEKRIMVADRGGREVNLVTNYTRINPITTEEPIITAKMNESGYIAVVTQEKGYKGKITVYDPHGHPVYIWHSVENYIIDVDISEDGKRMAVCVMDTTKGKVSGGLMSFYLNEEEPYWATEVPDTLITSIKYYKDNGLVAVGDNRVLYYSPFGEERWRVNYDSRALQTFNIDSDRFIVVALNEGKGGNLLNNKTVIEILDPSGKKTGSYEINGEVSSMDVWEEVIVFNNKRDIYVITSKGEEACKLTVTKDIKDMILFKNKKQVLVVSTNELDILSLK